MDCFTMLPNNLFYSSNTISLFKEIGDYKLLLVMDYLNMRTTRLGNSMFTIEDIITYYGYKPDAHKGAINEQIKRIIKFLIHKGLVDCNEDIDKLKINKLVWCNYNGISTDTDGNGVEFTKIHYLAVKKILSYRGKKIDNTKLLFYYSYLCSRIYTRLDGTNVNENGGRAEVCFPSYRTISDDIDIVDISIKQYNDILISMNLIRIGNLGLYHKKGDKRKVLRESPNFYALYTNEPEGTEEQQCLWYMNLKEGKKLYKKMNPDKVFIGDREYKNNNKKINGYITRINTLEKQGKATKEQIIRRDEYLKSLNFET